MANISGGSNTANKANVDVNYNLNVTTPQAEEQAGFVQMSSEVDAGDVLGTRTVRAAEVSHDYRLRVGTDSPLFNMSFEGTIVAQANISQTVTTMTIAQANGFLTLNNSAITTLSTSANIRTYRTFPLIGSYPTYLDMWIRDINSSATNATSEWGFGYATGAAAPTDGIFFRRTAAGILQAVINFAGTETLTAITTTNVPSRDGIGVFDPAETNHYVISNHNDDVEFWINDILVSRIAIPATQPGPSATSLQPVFARVYTAAVASSVARQLQIGFLQVAGGDIQNNKPWSHQMVGSGGGAYQNQLGVASGQTSNYANNTAPTTAATLSNTAASYTTLGGLWAVSGAGGANQLGAGAETDYALFAYQVPTGSNALPGKTLYITDIRIGEVIVTGAAVGATPTLLSWGIGVGSTAVSLATADGIAAVGPRRLSLGSQLIPAASAIGTTISGFPMTFTTPLVCPTGTFVHIILRNPIGVGTASLVYRGGITIHGYFE